jgi:Xaa-Pro aminopeptidase
LWRKAADVDAIVTCSFHNSYYLSGFPMNPWGRYAITVSFRNDDPVLIVPELEYEAARSDSPIRDCAPITTVMDLVCELPQGS